MGAIAIELPGPAHDAPRERASANARTGRVTGAETSDADAIAAVRQGDAEAFRTLVERYQGRAFRLAMRVLRNEEAAKDAVQDAFLKAYSALDRFEGRSSFYTWFYRMVMNQCLDAKRRDKSARHVAFEEQHDDDGPPTVAPEVPEVAGVSFAPAAERMRGELRTALAQAIDALPEGPRETLILREVEGLSYAEIAKAQSIPKGTVMSRLHNARKKLQELLLEAGIANPAETAARAGESE